VQCCFTNAITSISQHCAERVKNVDECVAHVPNCGQQKIAILIYSPIMRATQNSVPVASKRNAKRGFVSEMIEHVDHRLPFMFCLSSFHLLLHQTLDCNIVTYCKLCDMKNDMSGKNFASIENNNLRWRRKKSRQYHVM